MSIRLNIISTNPDPLLLGRRRPFIIYYTIIVILALVLLYTSQLLDLHIMQVTTFLGFALIDTSLWTLEAPKSAYLLEVFNEKDQVIMLNGNVFFSGAGGMLGFIVTSYLGKSMIRINFETLN